MFIIKLCKVKTLRIIPILCSKCRLRHNPVLQRFPARNLCKSMFGIWDKFRSCKPSYIMLANKKRLPSSLLLWSIWLGFPLWHFWRSNIKMTSNWTQNLTRQEYVGICFVQIIQDWIIFYNASLASPWRRRQSQSVKIKSPSWISYGAILYLKHIQYRECN